jgi:hypothetical protein
MIDLSEKRLTALENRIPPTIWLMLLLIAFLTASPLVIGNAEILAGSGGHTADDRHRYRGPGQPAQWLSSRGSAQP